MFNVFSLLLFLILLLAFHILSLFSLPLYLTIVKKYQMKGVFLSHRRSPMFDKRDNTSVNINVIFQFCKNIHRNSIVFIHFSGSTKI